MPRLDIDNILHFVVNHCIVCRLEYEIMELFVHGLGDNDKIRALANVNCNQKLTEQQV